MNAQDPGHWTENEDLLERFVKGNVADQELTALSQHLSDCRICRGRVDMERRISLGIRRLNRDERKASIRRGVDTETRNIPWPRLLSIAAVIVVLTGIGLYNRWFFQARREPNEQRHTEIAEQKKLDNGAQPLPMAPESKAANTEQGAHTEASVERDHPSIKNKTAEKKSAQPLPSGIRVDSEDTAVRTTPVTVHLVQDLFLRENSGRIPDQEARGAVGKDITLNRTESDRFGSMATRHPVQLTVYQPHPDSMEVVRRTRRDMEAVVTAQGENLLLRFSGAARASDTVVLMAEVESHSPDSVLIRSVPPRFWFLLPAEFLSAPPEHLRKH